MPEDIVRTDIKNGYELASNKHTLDQLVAMVEASGDQVKRAYVNRFGCSVVIVKYAVRR